MELKQFTSGLLAAHKANIALDIGDADAPRLLTQKDLRDLEGSALASDSDQPRFESQRLDAAFRVFRQTGSLPAAIEGLSFRARGQRHIHLLTRRTILYLILIVSTAIACLLFFWFHLRPELEMIRRDIITTSSVELPEHYDGLMVLACGIMLLLLLFVLLRQLFGVTNWFTRFSGGQEYLDLGQRALFWATTQRLVESGQPVSESTATAGQLLALDGQQTLPGGVVCESSKQIASAKDLLELLARQKIESVSNVFPTTAVVTVGGGCGLICAFATFYPVVRLLSELTTAASS